MIEVTDKRRCSGCAACVDSCPRGAIALRDDADGFSYPRVDPALCANCGICDRICPMASGVRGVTNGNAAVASECFAAQLREKPELDSVSSGGAMWGVTLAMLAKGGVVYGAEQVDVDTVRHARAETREEALRLRRSKYLQSETTGVFREVRRDLANGRHVLFAGTGCQVAGLLACLGEVPDRLVTCEVVCHGVPSRLVWKTFRAEKEDSAGSRIVSVVFRDKSAGWKTNQYVLQFADGHEEREPSARQIFHAGYLRGLFSRPSCGSCPFSSLPRVADLTFADYWKYGGALLANGDRGISLVRVNSVRGRLLLEGSAPWLEVEPTDEARARASCRHLCSPPRESPDRAAFFELFRRVGYHDAVKRFLQRKRKPFSAKIRDFIRRVVGSRGGMR